jgi:hypothetical protein
MFGSFLPFFSGLNMLKMSRQFSYDCLCSLRVFKIRLLIVDFPCIYLKREYTTYHVWRAFFPLTYKLCICTCVCEYISIIGGNGISSSLETFHSDQNALSCSVCLLCFSLSLCGMNVSDTPGQSLMSGMILPLCTLNIPKSICLPLMLGEPLSLSVLSKSQNQATDVCCASLSFYLQYERLKTLRQGSDAWCGSISALRISQRITTTTHVWRVSGTKQKRHIITWIPGYIFTTSSCISWLTLFVPSKMLILKTNVCDFLSLYMINFLKTVLT